MMERRISLITLGVADMERSAAFYDALGWKRAESPPGIVVYDLLGQALGLYPKAELARDMGISPDDIGGFSGVTLGHNLREKEEVAELTARAEAAGGRVIRPPGDIFWGGHISYVADPEGHVWEFAWNPFSPLGKGGAFQWGGAG